ncbi:MAG: sigma-70 family RNA polymerase sigma factor [Actinobacteria bacterium]|nr:sigma-70 family RNA polymerase sigma factor [Actinomycetota bacterium]
MDDLGELIEAAKGGDRRAFDDLVRHTYEDTYTLAYRLTGNEEDARDVVQETYLRAWKGLKGFRGDARFSTWLYRITANASYTTLKKRRKHRHEPMIDEINEARELSPAADPEAAAEASLLRDEVAVAVAELPPKLRAVVLLRDVYGLSHEEIGEELGISVSAAKVRLHRARRRIHDAVFGEGKVIEHAV